MAVICGKKQRNKLLMDDEFHRGRRGSHCNVVGVFFFLHCRCITS